MTKAYWSTSAGKTIRLSESDLENVWKESAWRKRQIEKLENRGNYSSTFFAGLIGEKEGRRWLIEQGYKVCEFGTMEYYFMDLKNTLDGLKRRRNQKYIEEDKIYINTLEHKLKGIFGEKFEEMRKFFCAFSQLRKEVKEEVWGARHLVVYIGGIGPDFIVKKDNDFSFVEIKVNQSMLPKYQRICFKIAKRYGFKTFALRVKIESNIPKGICLIEF